MLNVIAIPKQNSFMTSKISHKNGFRGQICVDTTRESFVIYTPRLISFEMMRNIQFFADYLAKNISE
jgi:hypothetical protein